MGVLTQQGADKLALRLNDEAREYIRANEVVK